MGKSNSRATSVLATYFTNGLYWAFYYHGTFFGNGTSYLDLLYSTSTDGFSWSSPKVITSNYSTIAFDGTYFYFAYRYDQNQTSASMYFIMGLPTSSGRIFWSTNSFQPIFSEKTNSSYVISLGVDPISFDSSGDPWIIATESFTPFRGGCFASCTIGHTLVLKSSINNGSFVLQSGFPLDVGSGAYAFGGGPQASIVSFSSFPKGYAALVVASHIGHGYIQIWQGSSWSKSSISLPVTGSFWASTHENELDAVAYNSTGLLDLTYDYSTGHLTYSWINDNSYLGRSSLVYSNSTLYFVSQDRSGQSLDVYERSLNQSTWSLTTNSTLVGGTNEIFTSAIGPTIYLTKELGILFVSGLNPSFEVEYSLLKIN